MNQLRCQLPTSSNEHNKMESFKISFDKSFEKSIHFSSFEFICPASGVMSS